MSQSDQFTAAQHVNALEGLSSDEHVTLENLVRDVDQAVHLVLVPGTDARITSVPGLDAEAATLPASAGCEQYEDSFSRILGLPATVVFYRDRRQLSTRYRSGKDTSLRSAAKTS